MMPSGNDGAGKRGENHSPRRGSDDEERKQPSSDASIQPIVTHSEPSIRTADRDGPTRSVSLPLPEPYNPFRQWADVVNPDMPRYRSALHTGYTAQVGVVRQTKSVQKQDDNCRSRESSVAFDYEDNLHFAPLHRHKSGIAKDQNNSGYGKIDSLEPGLYREVEMNPGRDMVMSGAKDKSKNGLDPSEKWHSRYNKLGKRSNIPKDDRSSREGATDGASTSFAQSDHRTEFDPGNHDQTDPVVEEPKVDTGHKSETGAHGTEKDAAVAEPGGAMEDPGAALAEPDAATSVTDAAAAEAGEAAATPTSLCDFHAKLTAITATLGRHKTNLLGSVHPNLCAGILLASIIILAIVYVVLKDDLWIKTSAEPVSPLFVKNAILSDVQLSIHDSGKLNERIYMEIEISVNGLTDEDFGGDNLKHDALVSLHALQKDMSKMDSKLKDSDKIYSVLEVVMPKDWPIHQSPFVGKRESPLPPAGSFGMCIVAIIAVVIMIALFGEGLIWIALSLAVIFAVALVTLGFHLGDLKLVGSGDCRSVLRAVPNSTRPITELPCSVNSEKMGMPDAINEIATDTAYWMLKLYNQLNAAKPVTDESKQKIKQCMNTLIQTTKDLNLFTSRMINTTTTGCRIIMVEQERLVRRCESLMFWQYIFLGIYSLVLALILLFIAWILYKLVILFKIKPQLEPDCDRLSSHVSIRMETLPRTEPQPGPSADTPKRKTFHVKKIVKCTNLQPAL